MAVLSHSRHSCALTSLGHGRCFFTPPVLYNLCKSTVCPYAGLYLHHCVEPVACSRVLSAWECLALCKMALFGLLNFCIEYNKMKLNL
jgi:hypothetical protein